MKRCEYSQWALALALTLSWALPVFASGEVPPPKQTRPLLIAGATLHTISGIAIPDGRMLIDKGRIAAIGTAASMPDAAGVEVLNLKGKHVYPGLIAANTAMGLAEVSAVRATVDLTETGPLNPNVRALVAVNADSELIPVARANGVLAALSVPRAGAAGLIGGTSAVIQLDGWTWEDMAIEREAGLHVFLPSMRSPAAQNPQLSPQRIEDMQRTMQARLRTLDEAFESAAAYAKALSAGESVERDERWESMRPVFTGARKVFVHADDIAQLRHALGFAERFALKIVIVGGADAPLIAPLLKAKDVPVIIAGVHRLPLRRNDPPETPFFVAAKLHAAGVKVVIARTGGAGDAARERSLPFEAGTAVAHGLPRADALRAITLSAAEVLGVADKLGSLDPGKLANFFVTDGDPLEIRTNVERVFIQGRELPMTDKQTRLRDKYEERYRQLGAERR
ncbi:MAG: amidohydrolase family protein [Betaproteobacteria bacterium]|nr:amidohydrolase family protein [Betaproteobacteria bacterium]